LQHFLRQENVTIDALLQSGLIEEISWEVYTFEVFNETFCKIFLEEVENFMKSGLPIRRPNSMNNYGLIVNEIGMAHMIDIFQANYIWPLARVLYPLQGSEFHGHHSFMVAYRPDQDVGLDMHTDDSDVTFNVCLGKEFKACGLTFCGNMGKANHRQFTHQYAHQLGKAVIHLGDRRHGADEIQEGERNNLIIWSHNHDWRTSYEYQMSRRKFEKESGSPDMRCLSWTHDRDFLAYKDYPRYAQSSHMKPWCPPRGYCYDGMEPIHDAIIRRIKKDDKEDP